MIEFTPLATHTPAVPSDGSSATTFTGLFHFHYFYMCTALYVFPVHHNETKDTLLGREDTKTTFLPWLLSVVIILSIWGHGTKLLIPTITCPWPSDRATHLGLLAHLLIFHLNMANIYLLHVNRQVGDTSFSHFYWFRVKKDSVKFAENLQPPLPKRKTEIKQEIVTS